jgi:hypothetical protein
LAILGAIRKWINLLVPINRIPLDVLSLIPTHLSSDRDAFRVSSVCHHWRRFFIQHAALWSRLRLTASTADFYMKTLLERSRGSVLDVIVPRYGSSADHVRAETLGLLPPHTQRIGNLDFVHNHWAGIQEFSEVVSGFLPLLQTLKIDVIYEPHWSGTWVMTPPSLLLFTGAKDLKEFCLHSAGLPFLDHFIFPNLTTLELSAVPEEGFPTLQLLDFLETSPTLQTVDIKIGADVLLEDVPPGRVVTLSNVETFKLSMDEYGPGCKIAAHISCPSARSTSLLYKQDADNIMSPDIFPASVVWDAVARQYTASPVEEVVFEMTTAQNPILTCLLTFLSPGPAVLALGFNVISTYYEDEDDEFVMTLEERYTEIVSQASMTIRTHPLLANIKRLSIRDRYITWDSDQLTQIAGEIWQLLESMGPLDALILDVHDLRPYLAPFLDLPEFRDMDRPGGFPPTRKLMIAQPSPEPEYMAAVVELAKSQHALGVPFERVTIHVENYLPEMVERLNPWVGVVYCCGETCVDDDG